MKRNRVILALSLLLFLVVLMILIFILRIRPLDYQVRGLEATGKIEVLLKVDDGNPSQTQMVKMIYSPEKINKIVNNIQSLRQNWQYDEFSPPYTSSFGKPNPVWLVFYDTNDRVQATLTLGYSDKSPYSLQEIYGPGRYLHHQEFKELTDLLEIDEKLTYYQQK